jgi:hypothetical protein
LSFGSIPPTSQLEQIADPEKNRHFYDPPKIQSGVNLLIPVGVPHMWYAAVQSKTVKLTALGEHYRRLAAKGLI